MDVGALAGKGQGTESRVEGTEARGGHRCTCGETRPLSSRTVSTSSGLSDALCEWVSDRVRRRTVRPGQHSAQRGRPPGAGSEGGRGW